MTPFDDSAQDIEVRSIEVWSITSMNTPTSCWSMNTSIYMTNATSTSMTHRLNWVSNTLIDIRMSNRHIPMLISPMLAIGTIIEPWTVVSLIKSEHRNSDIAESGGVTVIGVRLQPDKRGLGSRKAATAGVISLCKMHGRRLRNRGLSGTHRIEL